MILPGEVGEKQEMKAGRGITKKHKKQSNKLDNRKQEIDNIHEFNL